MYVNSTISQYSGSTSIWKGLQKQFPNILDSRQMPIFWGVIIPAVLHQDHILNAYAKVNNNTIKDWTSIACLDRLPRERLFWQLRSVKLHLNKPQGLLTNETSRDVWSSCQGWCLLKTKKATQQKHLVPTVMCVSGGVMVQAYFGSLNQPCVCVTEPTHFFLFI